MLVKAMLVSIVGLTGSQMCGATAPEDILAEAGRSVPQDVKDQGKSLLIRFQEEVAKCDSTEHVSLGSETDDKLKPFTTDEIVINQPDSWVSVMRVADEIIRFIEMNFSNEDIIGMMKDDVAKLKEAEKIGGEAFSKDINATYPDSDSLPPDQRWTDPAERDGAMAQVHEALTDAISTLESHLRKLVGESPE
jgi:hypothetical protein